MKTQPKRKVPTARELRALLAEIQSVIRNGGSTLSDIMLERLTGADQALKLALGYDTYLTLLVSSETAAIRCLHSTRSAPCGCGVCNEKR